MSRIGIGIDTGGTYTDAVAYDFDRRIVLGKAKALTTRHDLSIGILEALDNLPAGLASRPALVSLSTTLATNACVENKIGRARLFFLGGDAGLVDRHGGEYGLPPASEMSIQPSGTTYSDGVVGEVDWDLFLAGIDRKLEGMDGAGVVEVYAMRNNAVVERKAKALLASRTGIPIVCGHELVSDLHCLQRAASTLLNASLFPTIGRFLAAIRAAMARRGITAPVVIVRSDGNLMGEEFASVRPAETLLCGPAASVTGTVELAGERDCVVVDMGGTTTDIAVVRGGEPLRAENGIGIGKWKTFIKGVYVKTIGLGGDSAIHFSDRRLALEDYRVVPLCMAAAAHPAIVGQLWEMTEEYKRHTRFLHEGFLLVRDVTDSPRHSDFEKAFCRLLRGGPLLRRRAALAVGKDEYNLDVARLVGEGVVQVFGLTPTDIMHLRGDFTRYDAEASRLGARFVAENLGVPVDVLCDMAYEEVKRKLYLNVVKTLLELENARPGYVGVDGGAEQLIRQGFDAGRRGGGRGFARVGFATSLALVGIGAPIHLFLKDVAEMLGTRAVIPENSEVANALGAVVGRIHAMAEIEVRPEYSLEGITGYTVFGREETRLFEGRAEAEELASAEAEAEARAEAARRGATGEIAATCELVVREGESRHGALYLGARAIAHAIGSMSL